MADPTNPPLEGAAQFTNADRALLIAIAQKLNQPMPADLSGAAPNANLPGGTVLGGAASIDPNATPAFDPPGAPVFSAPVDPVNIVQASPPPPVMAVAPQAPSAPSNVIDPTAAPAFNPPENSPALVGLPQPAPPAIPRDTRQDFTAGQASDLAAIVALVREKFPHSLPNEIPAVLP